MTCENLILGHRGFIGSNFYEFLKKKNKSLKIIDTPKIKKKDITFFFNFLSQKILKYKPRYIWNFLGTHSSNLNQNLDSNFLLSYKLINLINNKKLNSKIIFIGSAIEDNFESFSNLKKKKLNYAISKNLQSLLINSSNFKKNFYILKLYNVYGDGVKINLFPGKINVMIKKILSKKLNKIKIKFYNDRRNYIHIDKVVKKMYLLINKKKIKNNFSKIRSNKEISNFQLFKIVAKKNGIKSFKTKVINKDLILYNFDIKQK